MQGQFLESLSRDLTRLLVDTDDYNVIIHAGNDSHVEPFKAHTNILRARSPYFRTALSSDWIVREDGIIVFRKPNISPTVFDIILKYIYAGKIVLEEQDPADILDLLVAADELILEELVDYVQNYLIRNEFDWLQKNFIQVMHTVFRLQACNTFQDHCIDAICGDPQSFFSSEDFASIEEDILLALLKRDDLEIEEVEIWDYLVSWGVEQTPGLEMNVKNWTAADFAALEKTIHNCIPLIRFFAITASEFYDHVRPYKSLLPVDLYEDLVKSHYKPQSLRKIVALPPRSPRIDSHIIHFKHITTIAHWIAGESGKPSNFYKAQSQFKLLYRGTRDGFTPKAFRSKCSNKGANVVVLKIQDSKKIIGGYNPIGWRNRADYAETKDSFIFSMDDSSPDGHSSIAEEPKLSRVSVNMSNSAIFDLESYGPNFGKGDLVIYENCKTGSCRKYTYEHEIIDPGDFVAEEFEVFKVIDNFRPEEPIADDDLSIPTIYDFLKKSPINESSLSSPVQ